MTYRLGLLCLALLMALPASMAVAEPPTDYGSCLAKCNAFNRQACSDACDCEWRGGNCPRKGVPIDPGLPGNAALTTSGTSSTGPKKSPMQGTTGSAKTTAGAMKTGGDKAQ